MIVYNFRLLSTERVQYTIFMRIRYKRIYFHDNGMSRYMENNDEEDWD